MTLPIVEVVTCGNKVEGIIIDGKCHEVGSVVFKDCYFEDRDGVRHRIAQISRADRMGYAVMTGVCLLIYFSGILFGAVVF